MSVATAKRDYYEVLGVARDADQKVIKDAFRTLALKYHPDRNKAADAEERFKEIAEAYAVLSDGKKRADYDAGGFAGIGNVSEQDLFSGVNFNDIFKDINFGFGFGNPFESIFNRHRSRVSHGANIDVELFIQLEKVATGGEEIIRLNHPITCQACHGLGSKDGEVPKQCTSCNGTGHITHSRQEKGDHVLIQEISVCPECNGRGNIIEQLCPLCNGSGEIEKIETLSVVIPKGVEEGMVLRITGKGMPSPDVKGKPGDLLVIVHTRSDPRFVRDGADLIRVESVNLVDAVLGTTLEVPTVDGSATVTVPPGTQPGALLRLKNKGLAEYASNKLGSLYLRIEVKVPEKLSGEERELYERLRKVGSKWKFWK